VLRLDLDGGSELQKQNVFFEKEDDILIMHKKTKHVDPEVEKQKQIDELAAQKAAFPKDSLPIAEYVDKWLDGYRPEVPLPPDPVPRDKINIDKILRSENVDRKSNDLNQQNEFHDTAIKILQNYIKDPHLRELNEREIYGNQVGQMSMQSQFISEHRSEDDSESDANSGKTSSNSDTSNDERDMKLPRFSTGILSVKFKDRKAEPSCILQFDNQNEEFVVIMNAHDVISKKHIKGSMKAIMPDCKYMYSIISL